MPTVRSPTLKLNSPCYPCVCLSRDRYYLSSVTLNLFMGCPGVPCWKALSFSFGTRLFQIPYSTYNEARKKEKPSTRGRRFEKCCLHRFRPLGWRDFDHLLVSDGMETAIEGRMRRVRRIARGRKRLLASSPWTTLINAADEA